MFEFEIVRITSDYRQSSDVLAQLWRNEATCIANLRHVGSVSGRLLRVMKQLPAENFFVILNKHINRGNLRDYAVPNKDYPFANYYKNGAGYGILTVEEALRGGNYFLCISPEEDNDPFATEDGSEEIFFPQSTTSYEYRCHCPLTDIGRWRNDPPYVNLDRSPESIGSSSWDGNLVSWFRAGFSTRLNYAVKGGLIDEE